LYAVITSINNASFHTEKKADSLYLGGVGEGDWLEAFLSSIPTMKLRSQIGRGVYNGIPNDSEIQETRELFWGESGRGLKLTNPLLLQN
jgi:hypothetical protein